MIPYSKQSINEDDIQAVIEALKSDYLTGGSRVGLFEKELCKYLGVKYACTVNSATSALHLACLACGLKKDDEVITTPITFSATSNAIIMSGAIPIFCDVKSDGNIDETKIQKLITPRTKAIIPVDFGGNPAQIDEILKLCSKYNLTLIEDSCHALGGEIKGDKIGNKADMSIFSFHAIKPITTCGEGGAIVTNNKKLYNKVKLLRSHGIVKKGLWDSQMNELGYNYRLSDVASSLGISQIKRLDSFIAKREEIAKFYDEFFKKCSYFSTIRLPSHVKSARHLYPILLTKELCKSKESIFKELHANGIGVQVHYKPIYHYSYYQKLLNIPHLDGAEKFYRAELSIPCHQGMNLDDASFVANTLLNVLAKYT